MKHGLGLAVGADAIDAVRVTRGRIVWVGHAAYATYEELGDLVGQLVAEAGRARRVRVVLHRDAVQLRSVGAPPIRARQARRAIAAQAGQLFRANGAPLVVDGRLLDLSSGQRMLLGAAAAEPLVQAVVAACERASLRVKGLGVTADVWPAAIDLPAGTDEVALPVGPGVERLSLDRGRVWRSRWQRGAIDAPVPWVASLGALGDAARHAAAPWAALGNGTGRRLNLLPATTHAARGRRARRRTAVALLVAGAVWLAAGVTHVGRLVSSVRATRADLTALAPAADSVVALRREVARTEGALAALDRVDRARSQTLALLAALTVALDDGTSLHALSVDPDGSVRLSGRTASTSGVLADLQRVPRLTAVRLDGASRLHDGGGPREEFTVTAQLGGPP